MYVTIDQIIDQLQNDKIVILDTDTIPGLSCLVKNKEQIIQLKGKPNNAPLSVLISNLNQLPLTSFEKQLLLASYGQSTIITSENIGVRLTAAPELIQIIERTGPLISTSCNLYGQPHVLDCLQAQRIFNVDYFQINSSKSSRPSRIIRADPFEVIR